MRSALDAPAGLSHVGREHPSESQKRWRRKKSDGDVSPGNPDLSPERDGYEGGSRASEEQRAEEEGCARRKREEDAGGSVIHQAVTRRKRELGGGRRRGNIVEGKGRRVRGIRVYK
ncbi:hypothetical protein KM043_016353 [Ampulex compressa]|nr:hypothetical protein KM043_016353 [Ampulex compressa]